MSTKFYVCSHCGNIIEKVKDALDVGQEVEARVVKVDRADRRIGLSIRAMSMTEDEIKALEAEAAGETPATTSTGPP